MSDPKDTPFWIPPKELFNYHARGDRQAGEKVFTLAVNEVETVNLLEVPKNVCHEKEKQLSFRPTHLENSV